MNFFFYPDIQEAYKTSTLANKLGRLVAAHYYIRKTNREKDFLTKSATERYHELVNADPNWCNRFPFTSSLNISVLNPKA